MEVLALIMYSHPGISLNAAVSEVPMDMQEHWLQDICMTHIRAIGPAVKRNLPSSFDCHAERLLVHVDKATNANIIFSVTQLTFSTI